jgi:hypothetical protein
MIVKSQLTPFGGPRLSKSTNSVKRLCQAASSATLRRYSIISNNHMGASSSVGSRNLLEVVSPITTSSPGKSTAPAGDTGVMEAFVAFAAPSRLSETSVAEAVPPRELREVGPDGWGTTSAVGQEPVTGCSKVTVLRSGDVPGNR